MARTIHGINLTAPDGIEQLLAYHRATFGDAVMEEGAGDGAEGTGGDGADGAEGAGTDTGDGADGAEGAGKVEGEEALGDPGKKALDTMKAKLKAANAELKTFRDAQELAGKTADEQEQARLRQDAESRAIAKANERILRADVKAAAAGKLKNPEIAVKLLDLSSFEADEEGNFDQSEIETAIGDLLKAEPYLAAQGGTVQFDSGRGKQAPGGQITRAELEGMSAQEILKANREGRLKGLTKK